MIAAFVNKVLRRIVGPEIQELSGDWRKLHNLYPSPNIVRIKKSREVRWVGRVASMSD
jgi:hypothetical protein